MMPVFTHNNTTSGDLIMTASALSLHEREEIRAGIERNDTTTTIAGILNRHRCTISAEIKRNGGRQNYSAVTANKRACTQRRRPKPLKLETDPELFAHVQTRIEARDSPKVISIELATGVHGLTRSISHETIYQAIYQNLFGKTVRTPARKRRKRKNRNAKPPGSNALGIYCSIHDRPVEALKRKVVGHFEGDLIVGANNQSALITVFDRASRLLLLSAVKSKRADDVKHSLCQLLARIPPALRLSLTWDQGAELARHREIWAETGMYLYFADPKSPWQRPTNENGNSLVRNHVGKGTDLSIYTPQDLQAIEDRINSMPRRIFNWASANDQYTQLVATTD